LRVDVGGAVFKKTLWLTENAKSRYFWPLTEPIMELTGIHHLTAVTANVSQNHTFYTRTLGMRLVKKTVNQDDVSAYHLFYADGEATPGTDLTFFDWRVPREQRGTNSIICTGLRVAGGSSIEFWARRLTDASIQHRQSERNGRIHLDFEDFEGQRLSLTDDGDQGEAHPWLDSPVPTEHQIRGLGPIVLSVAELEPTQYILTDVLGMRSAAPYRWSGDGRSVHVFEMGTGGPAAELHVMSEANLAKAALGAGGVHHLALRTPDIDHYNQWIDHLKKRRIPSSGPVDRYYFRSLYFREPNGILFEIATDGPGFTADEPLEKLGERLALPPFLEARRSAIEAALKPLA
jgi:glyoxalase family protein